MWTGLKVWTLIDITVRFIIIASFRVTRMYLMDLCVNKLETIYHQIWFTSEKKINSPPPYLGSRIWKVSVKWEPFSEVHKLFSVIMTKVNGKKMKSGGKKERRCCNHVATLHMHTEDKSIMMMARRWSVFRIVCRSAVVCVLYDSRFSLGTRRLFLRDVVII